jgi:hypothetical protein
MPPSQKSLSFLWLGLALSAILSLAFSQPVPPNDFWWYVRLGEEIMATGAIPQVDTFSYTQAGQPMVYHSWLAAVVLAWVYQTGGIPLTVLLKGGLLAIFYTSLWQVCRQAGAGARLASLLLLVAALAGSNNWVIRPQLFSYALFGLTFWLIYQWDLGQRKWLWLLPLIMLAWVNLHGAFILGFLLVGSALVFGKGERRILGWMLLGMVVATLVTPRLWGSWEYVWTLITDPSSQEFSTEWRPPTTADWMGKLFFGWLLLFPLLIHFSPRRLTNLHWVWFVGLGWMALSGIRYVIWFVAILTMLTAYLLHPIAGRYLDKPVKQVKPMVNGVITAMFLLLSGLFLPQIRQAWWPDARPILSSSTPEAATTWLASQQPPFAGPLWSNLDFASYHVYALPEYPVWIDTRFELYPTEQWERYLDISSAAPQWADIVDEEGFNLLMLKHEEQERLIEALHQRPQQWGICYQDEIAVLFVRLDGRPLPANCAVANAFGSLLLPNLIQGEELP